MNRLWLERSTTLFLGAVDGLPDDGFGAPSALPTWTRAHVVAHVHFNALALVRLVAWAATGQEQRMYANAQQRASEIENGAQLPPSQLRELVHTSAAELTSSYDALSEADRAVLVVTAQGRTVPAAEICWMRTREVAIHSIDLDTGTTWVDLGDELNQALAADALAYHSRAGHLAGLTAWLTGRSPHAPAIGRWL